MKEEEHQKELFEFEKPKRTFPKLGRIFTRADTAVTLTMEKVVFISIGLVMLAVVIYALGVEKGKSQESLSVVQEKPVSSAPVETKPISQIKAPPEPAKIEPVQGAAKSYTIVAAAFVRKDTASAEADRLKGEGYEAFVAESSPYFLVCVGSYADKEGVQSKNALNKIRRIYKDAYFKLR